VCGKGREDMSIYEAYEKKYSAETQQADEIYEQYLKQCKIETDHDILYHYTSFAGLQGILANKRFWFTNYSHLNDPSEVCHALEILENHTNKIIDPSKHLDFYIQQLKFA
jgi:hypothetical protein